MLLADAHSFLLRLKGNLTDETVLLRWASLGHTVLEEGKDGYEKLAEVQRNQRTLA